MSSSLGLTQLELLRALDRHGVEFVVLGGVAAQLQGWHGATVDLDIAVSREPANVERLNRALAAMGADQGRVGGLGTAFRTRHGRLEIVRRADAIGDYPNWRRNARTLRVEADLTVLVAAPMDILASKEAAGREKDRAALPQMREDFRDAGVL
jgi:hypothetical protein